VESALKENLHKAHIHLNGAFSPSLSNAKKFVFLGSDYSNIYMADYLEKNAAYETDLQQNATGVTSSQRRRMMEAICAKDDPPDYVFASGRSESDAGGDTVMKGLFTGRASTNFTGTMDGLRCRDRWRTSFGVKVVMNQGLYNMDQANMSRVLGTEFAKAFMQLAGKTPPPDKK
jgi:hypothetical protein